MLSLTSSLLLTHPMMVGIALIIADPQEGIYQVVKLTFVTAPLVCSYHSIALLEVEMLVLVSSRSKERFIKIHLLIFLFAFLKVILKWMGCRSLRWLGWKSFNLPMTLWLTKCSTRAVLLSHNDLYSNKHASHLKELQPWFRAVLLVVSGFKSLEKY